MTQLLLGVLFRPREYLPRLAASPSAAWAMALAAIWGMERALTRGVVALSPEMSPATYLVKNLAFGAALSISGVWLTSSTVAWAVRKLGGSVEAPALRTVFAWSSVPKLFAIVAVAALLLVEGTQVVWVERRDLVRLMPLGPFVVLVQLATSVWSASLAVTGVSAVSGLPVKRAIGACLLGGGIVVALIVAAIALRRMMG